MKLFKVFSFTFFLCISCVPLLSWGMEDEASSWDERLFIKIRENDIDGIREALTNYANVNAEGYCVNDLAPSISFVTKPLHESVKRGYYDIAALLLRSGAGVNDPDEHGNAPSHWAAENGSIDVLLLLLNNGADMLMKSGDGPLSYGILSSFSDGDLSLHRAVKSKKYAAVVLLYDKSLLEVENANGRTPGYFAAKFDTTIDEMVEQGIKEFWEWYQNNTEFDLPEHVRKMFIEKRYLPSFRDIQMRAITGGKKRF